MPILGLCLLQGYHNKMLYMEVRICLHTSYLKIHSMVKNHEELADGVVVLESKIQVRWPRIVMPVSLTIVLP